MRIAIVNDTIMAVEALRRVVNSVPDYEIAWVARDGSQAVTKCVADPPDLILMDMIMPVMDGVDATRAIVRQSPCAILIVTSSVQKNSARIFEAMGYGALDVVSTPVLGRLGNPEVAQQLLAKIATIATLIGKPNPKFTTPLESASPISKGGTTKLIVPPLVVMGASTGGPNALANVLSQLPARFPAAITIIQHVDIQFAPGLAKWLDGQTPLKVRLGLEGSRLEAGTVLVAASNDHLILRPNLTLTYTRKPEDYPYRPSVDVFCKSVAQHWSRKGLAILLTGMGRDGALGLSLLRSKGWHTIAQDRQSCVVYGMPKAAVEMDSAVEVLPLAAIAPTLIRRLIPNPPLKTSF